jgi:hypothetical protein
VTPLADAIRNGRVEIAKFLSARGATMSNSNTTVIPKKEELRESAFKKRAKKTMKENNIKLPPLMIKTRY